MNQEKELLSQQVQVKEKVDTMQKIVLGVGMLCAFFTLFSFATVFGVGAKNLADKLSEQDLNWSTVGKTKVRTSVLDETNTSLVKIQTEIVADKLYSIKYTDRNGVNVWETYNSLKDLNVPVSAVSVNSQQQKSSVVLANTNQVFPTLISSPFNNDVLRAGDNIRFTGTVASQSQQGNAFQNYIFQYGLGQNPTVWNNTGFTLVNHGLSAIINGALATWNTSFIAGAGFYTVRLRVNFANGEYEYKYVHNLALDPTLKEGWPVRIGTYEEGGQQYISVGNSGANVSDLDHDGHLEIIIFIGGTPGKLMVYRDNGQLLWQANVGTTAVSNGSAVYPVIGDINNDGYEEIIAFNYRDPLSFIPPDWTNSEVHAFSHNGNELWSTLVPKDYRPGLLMADLDRDGNKEIVIKGNGAANLKVTILNNGGQIISQWNLEPIQWIEFVAYSLPAVGNFDNDPQLEIVVGKQRGSPYENQGSLAVYNMDGSILPGWPVITTGASLVSPAVGDVNNDGDNEIVVNLGVAMSPINAGIVVYDKNGAIINGWPQMTNQLFVAPPSLGKFGNENYLRIGDYPLYLSSLYLHNNNGTVINGWPQSTINRSNYGGSSFADIDNDGVSDVILSAGPDLGYNSLPGTQLLGMYAWNGNGGIVAGFPKAIESGMLQYSTVIKDIDDDGLDELIAVSQADKDYTTNQLKSRSSIYVWELNSQHNATANQWPEFQYDPQHTGYLPPIN